MLVPFLSAPLAHAQAIEQTFDGSGVSPPPDGVSLRDPSMGWGGQFPGAPVVELTGWAAQEPLVRRVTDGPRTVDRPLLDDLFGVGLAALVPTGPRVALGVRLPVWLGSGGASGGGPAPGDVVVSAPVRVTTGEGPRLLLVPSLRAPTGASARWLGDPGIGGSVVASGSASAGPVGASLDLGLWATGATDQPDWPGGVGASWAGGVVFAPNATVALHAELAGRAPLGREVPGVPVEALASVRASPGERSVLTAVVGTGVVRGVGAASLRLGAGARVAFGHREVQAPPVAPPPPVVVTVVDPQGAPVVGATVVAGGHRAQTDASGEVTVPARAARQGSVTVTADGYLPASAATPDGEAALAVALVRAPVPVTVSVVGPQGALPGVFVDVERAGGDLSGEASAVAADERGLHRFDLPAGVWTVHLGAPGMGLQERTLVIEPTRSEPIRVDAVLTPVEDPAVTLAVKVVDGFGHPVEDAVVALGDRDLGTTGTGGDVVVQGLAAGEVALVIRSSRIGDRTVVPATLSAGRNEIVATFEWPAGSLLVRVTDPKGRPIDAGVTFAGPSRLPERALGSDGEELFVLRPGAWTVTAAADAFAPQTRRVTVGDRAGGLVRLDLALLPAEGGRSTLELAVRDVDGAVVPGAQLLVDGAPIGVTGTDGDVTLNDLRPGQRFLEVRGERLVPFRSEVELSAARQREELVVWYVPGVVDVEVRGPKLEPVDARVAFSGPSPLPSAQTGPDGRARVLLPPGTWQVATSSEAYGLRVDEVVVVENERRRHLLDLRLAPVTDATAVLDLVVRDPEGRPVEAEVALDGSSTGSTPGGHVRLEGLPPGPAGLDVLAPGFLPVHRDVQLADTQSLVVTLPWAPGALEVEVVGPKGPVDGVLVAVAGPGAVPSRETTDGVARVAARPGTWWVMASHPDFAVAEQQVVLPEASALTRITLPLAPVEPDDAPVVISVRDEAGRPLAEVPVAIDGVEVGRTSAAGTVALSDRPQGKATVVVIPGPGFESVELPVVLKKGRQRRATVVVPFTPAPVSVEVVNGGPGTRLQVFGPDRAPTVVPTAPDGSRTLTLPPGTFTLVAEDESRAGSATVTVAPGVPAQVRVELFETGTTVVGGLLRLTTPILFDAGRHELRPDALPILDDVARRLLVDRAVSLVEVQGHTSDEGGVAYNQQLSEARARAIRDALVARGVEPERVVWRGYGLSRPIAPGKDESSRAQNRRVELAILDRVDPGAAPPERSP